MPFTHAKVSKAQQSTPFISSQLSIIIIIIIKSFRKYASNIPGNHEVKELQKTAILGTPHILQKVLI